MRNIKLWIDDIRRRPSDYGFAAVSTNEALAFLIQQGWHTDGETNILLDLDHDAGAFVGNGGDFIEVLNWIEKMDYIEKHPSLHLSFRIHSMNPVGRENMAKIIKKNGWALLP